MSTTVLRKTASSVARRQLAAMLCVVATFLATWALAVVAAPVATACPAGSYQAASGDCVERPDDSTSGVTAICGDGSDSHSETRSGTCSHHGGVEQWCPCSGMTAAGPASPPVTAANDPASLIATGGDDQFVALAISPVTRQLGWGTAGSQGRADDIASSECGVASGGACQVAAEMHNGCVAVAVDSTNFLGSFGPTSSEAVLNASSQLPNGHIAAVQCSK